MLLPEGWHERVNIRYATEEYIRAPYFREEERTVNFPVANKHGRNFSSELWSGAQVRRLNFGGILKIREPEFRGAK